MSKEYLAFSGKQLIARGDLPAIVSQTKAIDSTLEPVVLEYDTCKRVEFSWHGDEETVLQNLPAPETSTSDAAAGKRGRPKLGVTSKEVTLLPRHWEWLKTQRGGASVTLRRLVDQAMKNIPIEDRIKMKQNQLYALMSMLSDEPGFEEATRALYRNSRVSFEQAITTWPENIRTIVLEKFEAINLLHQGQTDD